jgi:hypothetical protein
MATIKTQNNRRNAANDGWDVIHQETSADIVLMEDETTVEENINSLQTAAGTAATHIGTANIHVKITSGTADPTGGVDGDVYLQYEA